MKVKVVIINTEDHLRALAEPERFCSEGRLNKCRATLNAAVRMQGYAAELAISYALSGAALLPPVYSYEKSGKPVIENGFISISHSGKYAVCAVADAPVGVDIEVRRTVSPAISRRVLTDAERAEYRAEPSDDYLLRKFVIKEAYFKMTGEGLGGSFRGVEETEGRLVRKRKDVGYAFEFEPEYAVACIVTEEKLEAEDVDIIYPSDI